MEALPCECGFTARAPDERALADDVRRHAWEAHRMALTAADAVQLIRRTHSASRRPGQSGGPDDCPYGGGEVMTSKRVLAISLAATGVAAIGVATIAGSAAATPSSGLTTTILAKSTVPALDLRAHAPRPDAWRVRLTSHGLSDGYVVDNVIAPGGTTGWHSHPGPSLIFVVRGAVTNYESDDPKCTGHVYVAGSSFVDAGGRDVHTLRNNGDVPAETIAVQLIPSGAQRRIDAAAPPNCAP